MNVQYFAIHFIVFVLLTISLMRLRKRNFLVHLLVLYSLTLITAIPKPMSEDKTAIVKAVSIVTKTSKDSETSEATAPQCDRPTIANDEGAWEFDEYAYVNGEYGYQVGLPDGLIALRNPCPAPDRGFLIRLSENSLPRIEVNADYNASFWSSPHEAYQLFIAHLKNTYQSVDVIKYRSFHIGRSKAIHFVAQCKIKKTRNIVIRDQFVVFRYDDRVVYEFGLTTYPYRHKRDKRVLNEILRNWDTIPFGENDYVCNQ